MCLLSVACILKLLFFKVCYYAYVSYVCDNSIIGGSFIIAGLYTVTWGSYRERQAPVGVTSHGPWVAEPLIHEKNAYQIGHLFSGSSSVSSSPKLSD